MGANQHSPAPRAPSAGVPRHIAIVMDGNGRWAKRRMLPRSAGHRQGVSAVRRICEACDDRGVEVLTVYAFSSENWKRSSDEVGALMGLFERSIRKEIGELHRRNVRLLVSGRLHELPDSLRQEFERDMEQTSGNTGLVLNLAINYGARNEIVDAARALARQVANGELAPDDIDAERFEQQLYTAGLPDPDLLIRAAGEMRISNFLLWQCAYTEFFVTDVLWPDFDETHLDEAIAAFRERERRFGQAPGLGAEAVG